MIKKFYFINPNSNKPTITPSKTYGSLVKELNAIPCDISKDPEITDTPFAALKRVLGEKFYEFENTKDDYLAINLEDNGVLSKEVLKQNIEIRDNMFMPFLSGILDMFASTANTFPIPADKVENLNIKVSIITTHGVISKEVNVKELGIWELKDDAIVGLKYENEMHNVVNTYNRNAQALQKLQTTKADQSMMKQLQQLQSENQSLKDKYDGFCNDNIEQFFNFIRYVTGIEIENFETEINDVCFQFSRASDIPPKQGEEAKEPVTIFETCLLMYHNSACKDIHDFKKMFLI